MNDILERLLEQEVRLRFPLFNEESAWELGCLFAERAKRDDLSIAVDIATKDRVLFHHSRAGASPDNEAWIRRKKRTVNRFGHSSLYIGKKLESLGLTLAQKYYLSERSYAAHGGCFPLIVDGVGVIGTVTVSGLPQEEDHALVVDVIGAYLAGERARA
jgi:uncharacterized protein (UPF0303 family)